NNGFCAVEYLKSKKSCSLNSKTNEIYDFEPPFTPVSESYQTATVWAPAYNQFFQISQKFRSSSDPLKLTAPYYTEIELAAESLINTNTNLHLLMKSDFNRNPFQPVSSFNQHNWLYNQKSEKTPNLKSDDTHTSILQYGDPNQVSQNDDLTGFNASLTLEKFNSKGLENSLVGKVLSKNGLARVYDIEQLINAKSKLLANFYQATLQSVSECDTFYYPTSELSSTTENLGNINFTEISQISATNSLEYSTTNDFEHGTVEPSFEKITTAADIVPTESAFLASTETHDFNHGTEGVKLEVSSTKATGIADSTTASELVVENFQSTPVGTFDSNSKSFAIETKKGSVTETTSNAKSTITSLNEEIETEAFTTKIKETVDIDATPSNPKLTTTGSLTENTVREAFSNTDTVSTLYQPTVTNFNEEDMHYTIESENDNSFQICTKNKTLVPSDFVFLIDASASMCPYTQALASGFSDFVT
ncbi:hypothetical protein HDU92_000536, partial [Lobulomyces angularis]